MSALGQKRTFPLASGMSALGQKQTSASRLGSHRGFAFRGPNNQLIKIKISLLFGRGSLDMNQGLTALCRRSTCVRNF